MTRNLRETFQTCLMAYILAFATICQSHVNLKVHRTSWACKRRKEVESKSPSPGNRHKKKGTQKDQFGFYSVTLVYKRFSLGGRFLRGGISGFWRLTSEKTVWGGKGGNFEEQTL